MMIGPVKETALVEESDRTMKEKVKLAVMKFLTQYLANVKGDVQEEARGKVLTLTRRGDGKKSRRTLKETLKKEQKGRYEPDGGDMTG